MMPASSLNTARKMFPRMPTAAILAVVRAVSRSGVQAVFCSINSFLQAGIWTGCSILSNEKEAADLCPQLSNK